MEFNINGDYDIRPDMNLCFSAVIIAVTFPFPVILREPKVLLTFAKTYKQDIFLNLCVKGQIYGCDVKEKK